MKGADCCSRVNFVVKRRSLRKEREQRDTEWFNLINKVSESVVEICFSPFTRLTRSSGFALKFW